MKSSLFSFVISKLNFAPVLAQSSSDADAAFGGLLVLFFCCMTIFWLAFAIIAYASFYKIHEKAGQPGWTVFIPYLNSIIIAHIVGREWWWGIIPFLNLVPYFELARKFGKSDGFGIGLVLLPFIFAPMLAFGNARFVGEPPKPLF